MRKYTEEEKTQLLTIARTAIAHQLDFKTPYQVDVNQISRSLKGEGAVFVTLKKRGELRGCIGHISAIQPLYKDVVENACSAAFNDPRFSPLTSEELSEVEIEISIMEPFEPLHYTGSDALVAALADTQPGVIIRHGGHQALFLPQVWEQLPNVEDFLGHLCIKAGLEREFWKTGNLSVELNTVAKFKEA